MVFYNYRQLLLRHARVEQYSVVLCVTSSAVNGSSTASSHRKNPWMMFKQFPFVIYILFCACIWIYWKKNIIKRMVVYIPKYNEATKQAYRRSRDLSSASQIFILWLKACKCWKDKQASRSILNLKCKKSRQLCVALVTKSKSKTFFPWRMNQLEDKIS